MSEPLRRWAVVIQAPEGYPAPSSRLPSKEEAPLPLNIESVLRVTDVIEYIDDSIKNWCDIKVQGGVGSDTAPFYIDLYKKIRVDLLGDYE